MTDDEARSGYVSALATRNASRAMQAIFSEARKFTTWRRLWIALAESERELGLEIPEAALEQMRAAAEAIDYDAAAAYEQRFRHDVMAHVHAFGDAAPAARPIIHLGATSQFVNCNTELLQIRDALALCAQKLAAAIDALARFARGRARVPTLGFTHLQPAQPTTVGRRAIQWAHDLALGLEELEHRLATLRFRGVKGTTGTQASFLALFEEDAAKVEALDKRVTEKMGWDAEKRFVVTGQTYPRVVDGQVLASLASVASPAMKCATDLRLLAHRKEIEEPFGKEQVGSSAMPYKRNPMRCERITGLCRFVLGQAPMAHTTASEQWLERSLDDSSTRRLILPEAFLALDGVLDLLAEVAGGLVVYPKRIERNLREELPFMATENLIMQAVRENGADRQEAHERVRHHSQAAAQRVKEEGGENDLIERLRAEPIFQGLDLERALDPDAFIGRAPAQVEEAIAAVVEPIRARYGLEGSTD